MTAYRTLLDNHASIERVVEEIPGGVRTVTTTADPDLVPTLLLHVTQMKELIEDGGRIRAWDPLFAEIFDNADKIEMNIETVEGGVAVTETSSDEGVAELIRAHAVKVNEFVARGNAAYSEATAIPEGYSSTP